MNDPKIAFFDFDGTLVDFDTINPFIRHVLSAHPEKDVEPDKSLSHKQYRLKLLAGLEAEELNSLAQSYYADKVHPFLINETLARMNALRDDGYEICIVSGSYDLYLRFFCAEMGIDNLVCTEVAFCDEDGRKCSLLELDEAGVSFDGFRCEGFYRFSDCMRENKLTFMEDKLGTSDWRNCDSIAFSDSQTDLPLLRSCRKAVVVAPVTSEVESWVSGSGFEILRYRYPLRRKLWRKICYYGRKLAGVSS